MAVKPNENDLEWYNKWDTLDDYYNNNFDTEYYSFDRYEREIDPRETMENVEAYDPQRQQMEIIKCARSFPYFCYKYVKIAHPTRGLFERAQIMSALVTAIAAVVIIMLMSHAEIQHWFRPI